MAIFYADFRNKFIRMDDDIDNTVYEQRISLGIALVRNENLSIRAAAKKVKVSHETLRRRYLGASSRKEFHLQLMALTETEEMLIESMLLDCFKSYSNMITSSFLCNLVNNFRRRKDKECKDLGLSWTNGFKKRHEKIKDILNRKQTKIELISILEEELSIYPSARIFNIMEFGFYLDQKNEQILKVTKRTDTKANSSSKSMLCSSVEMVSSDGLIHQSQSFDGAWMLASQLLDFLVSNFGTVRHPHSDPIIIFIDPIAALFTSQVLSYALERGIHFYLTPQHFNQPLDYLLSYNDQHLLFQDFAQFLSYKSTLSHQFIMGLFAKCGIFPLNRSIIMNQPLLPKVLGSGPGSGSSLNDSRKEKILEVTELLTKNNNIHLNLLRMLNDSTNTANPYMSFWSVLQSSLNMAIQNNDTMLNTLKDLYD